MSTSMDDIKEAFERSYALVLDQEINISLKTRFTANNNLLFSDARVQDAITKSEDAYNMTNHQREYFEKRAYSANSDNLRGHFDFDAFHHMFRNAENVSGHVIPLYNSRNQKSNKSLLNNIVHGLIGTHTPNIYDYWLLSAAQLNVAYTLAETNVLTTNEDSKIILNKLQDFENNIKTMAANTYQLAKAIADTIHYKESIIQPNF